MIQAVFLDSDGVLVDTERMFFEATQKSFKKHGGRLSRVQWSRWYLAEGKQSSDIAETCGVPRTRIASAVQERDDTFWKGMDAGVRIPPGVIDTVRELAARYRLAIVTGASRSHFERIHEHTGLVPFFECVITRDECGVVKPDPGGYVMAMEKLGLEPGLCLAVEDSPRGAAAAMGAGIPCIVVPTELTAKDLCPEGCIFVRSMADVIDAAEG
jgi:beta-phosphoglucomutase-like phosphatase (HAD superfamily)